MSQSHDDLVHAFAQWLTEHASGDAATAFLIALTPGALTDMWRQFVDECIRRREPTPAYLALVGQWAELAERDPAVFDFLAALASPEREVPISLPPRGAQPRRPASRPPGRPAASRNGNAARR